MELAHKALIHLIKGLKTWKQDLTSLPKDLHTGHLMLIQVALEEGAEPPNNLYDLMQMIIKPCCEWKIKGFLNFFPPDASLYEEYTGLSLEAEEFLEEHVSIEESEQKAMLKILEYCRSRYKNDPIYDEKYKLIRGFVTQVDNAVIPIERLYDFVQFVNEPELSKMCLNLYEPVPFPYDRFRLCHYCHWTMTMSRGRWRCFTRTCMKRGEADNPLPLPVENEKNLVRLTSGIHKFVLVPGIIEQALYRRLRNKGYNVELYPDVDMFDLRVRILGEVIDLDVKEQHSPFNLVQYLNSNMQKFHSNAYIVIPTHLVSYNPAYIDLVRSKLIREAQQINIVKEDQLDTVFSNLEERYS